MHEDVVIRNTGPIQSIHDCGLFPQCFTALNHAVFFSFFSLLCVCPLINRKKTQKHIWQKDGVICNNQLFIYFNLYRILFSIDQCYFSICLYPIIVGNHILSWLLFIILVCFSVISIYL